MSMVLIVDDVPAMREQYAYDLKRLGGYRTLEAAGGEEALEILGKEPVDCMILDLEMPGMDGFTVLKTLQSQGFSVPVIVYTGTGNYERCVRAVKLGAYSFIDKSETVERVAHEIENALERSRLVLEVGRLRDRLGDETGLIGESPVMKKLKEQISKIAPIPSPVLIQGESGSGKELVARAIHNQSGRGKKTFLAVNCAAIPENLVESELFGHEAGAFTGAGRLRKGAFEAASSGTLFLDEIGDLPQAAQAKLLRVLEGGQITRVGGTRELAVDTRIVAATNRDLEAEVVAGRFRQDLLFRLNVHLLRIPPLREHLADVPLLLEHFLSQTCVRFGVRRKGITKDAVHRLGSYGWDKNNGRELRNAVERMVIAAGEGDIGIEDIPTDIQGGSTGGEYQRSKTLKELKANAERDIVREALNRNGWQITKTAAELGLADHASLLKVMRRHDLKRK